jgi:Ca-activated chloride channel family protein
MTVETKELTTEEKIAKSSGNDTEELVKQLDAEGDELIKQAYPDKFPDEEKADEDDKGEEQQEESKEEQSETEAKEETGDQEDEQQEPKEEEIVAEEGETEKALRDKLAKSEKRVKDTRADYTRKNQELIEKSKTSEAVIDSLNQTILALKQTSGVQVETKKEEREQNKEIKKGLGDLSKHFEKLQNIDPEVAAPIKEVVESLVGQIGNLQETVSQAQKDLRASSLNSAEKVHFQQIDNAHSGWEEMIESDDFIDWKDGLPQRQKRHAEEDLQNGSADDLIELFNDYKKDKGITAEPKKETKTSTKKEDKLKKVQAITNPKFDKSKEINSQTFEYDFKQSELRAMSQEEYNKKEKQIDAAMAAKRILMD